MRSLNQRLVVAERTLEVGVGVSNYLADSGGLG